MQELEKILEEIDREVEEYMEIDFSDEYNTGFKDMAYMAKKIIRKYMNDGWIPVDERLPINDEGAVEVTVRRGYRTVGYYDQYREEWWTLDEDSILDVIAWKEPSEPYHQERSDKHDGE